MRCAALRLFTLFLKAATRLSFASDVGIDWSIWPVNQLHIKDTKLPSLIAFGRFAWERREMLHHNVGIENI